MVNNIILKAVKFQSGRKKFYRGRTKTEPCSLPELHSKSLIGDIKNLSRSLISRVLKMQFALLCEGYVNVES